MIKNAAWIKNRVSQMSPAEVWWRAAQIARAHVDGLSLGGDKVARKAQEVRGILPPVQGTWPITYFKAHSQWSGGDIYWQDPAGMSLPQAVHWSRLNYRDTGRYGDPKIAWELSRHQFLRHWVLAKERPLDERVNAVSHLILHWIEHNPYGYGINWCSSLEVALRLISWETAVETLGDENFHPRVLRAIYRSALQHSRHLQKFPSLFSSANNHRIGELLGEMAAAALVQNEAPLNTRAWLAWQALQQQAVAQISADGVDREQAVYYHAYALLYFKRAARYAEQLTFPVSLEFRQLIHRMQYYLDCLTDENGNWFEIGDRDDGDLYALLPWMLGPQPLSTPAVRGAHEFAGGGYVIWRGADDLHGVFRCGEFGLTTIAAHAHADQLSFLLKLGTVDILTDSGTCSYHDNPEWRHYFRGTAAHNTVLVNHTDQAEYGGPFLWNTAPHGHLEITGQESAAGEIAYPTPRGNVEHRRNLQFPLDGVRVEIADTVECDHTCHAALIWNFGPAVQVSIVERERSAATVSLQAEGHLLQMKISCSAPCDFALFRGDENVPAGFYSRQFGERKPIFQLRATSTGRNLEFHTVITKLS